MGYGYDNSDISGDESGPRPAWDVSDNEKVPTSSFRAHGTGAYGSG